MALGEVLGFLLLCSGETLSLQSRLNLRYRRSCMKTVPHDVMRPAPLESTRPLFTRSGLHAEAYPAAAPKTHTSTGF